MAKMRNWRRMRRFHSKPKSEGKSFLQASHWPTDGGVTFLGWWLEFRQANRQACILPRSRRLVHIRWISTELFWNVVSTTLGSSYMFYNSTSNDPARQPARHTVTHFQVLREGMSYFAINSHSNLLLPLALLSFHLPTPCTSAQMQMDLWPLNFHYTSILFRWIAVILLCLIFISHFTFFRLRCASPSRCHFRWTT